MSRLPEFCGTDLNIFSGKHPRAKPPLIIGHEFSGTIIENPKNLGRDLKIGKKVTVMPYLWCGKCSPCQEGYPHVCKELQVIGVDRNGGFAEFVSVPWQKVYRIHDEVPLKRAALIEPMAVGIHVLNRAGLSLGDFVVIMGGGPIGLLLAYLLRRSGIERIIVVEVNEHRIDRARALGFEAVHPGKIDIFDLIFKKTDGNGADAVFEVAGVPESIEKVVKLTRPHGKIMLVGVHKEPPRIDIRNAIFRELTFLTSRVSTNRDFEIAIRLIAEKEAASLDMLITHEFPLEKGEEAFQLANSTGGKHLKILFRT